MSEQQKVSSPPASPSGKIIADGFNSAEYDLDGTKNDFIYGGPFIEPQIPSPFIDTATPINIQLQGTFKQSFAYYSLKERMPVILTKVIDYLSREGNKIKSEHQASDEDLRMVMGQLTKLKNNLMTNKEYDKFTVDSEEARQWNQWMEELDQPKYYTNTWVWTECYIYRKIREACELTKGLQNFDPFDEQKDNQLASSLEPMCLVAERVLSMLGDSNKEQKKNDFVTLLKLTLWGNKCDLSLSAGASVALDGKAQEQPAEGAGKASAGQLAANVCRQVFDPFQMIIDFKDKLLVDDSAKVYDAVTSGAERMRKANVGLPEAPADGADRSAADQSPTRAEHPPAATEAPAGPPELTPVTFDIVCDNAGYELFTDLCLATFLIAQKIVEKVRFHVKKYPWFVSDVTPRDFKYVIESCKNSIFHREIPPEPRAAAVEGEASPPRVISSDALRQLGHAWAQHVRDGAFVMCADAFWTYPHVFKDMKKFDLALYRKLQSPAAVLFKGDLNYRKLLGETNYNPTVGFDAALQGFHPAPVIAVRTIKADLICGLPKGKWEELNKIEEKWMETGDYGVIQLSTKAEELKVSDSPCAHYEETKL